MALCFAFLTCESFGVSKVSVDLKSFFEKLEAIWNFLNNAILNTSLSSFWRSDCTNIDNDFS